MLNEPIIEIGTKDVLTITPDTTVSKALGLMEKNDYHNLIVLDDEGNIYMVIMHDLLSATSLNEKIETLMFKPHCINENTLVIEAVCEMVDCGQRGAPIVNDEGKLVGIVTDYDIMKRASTSELLKEVKVSKIMSRNPITIDYNDSIGKARSLMKKYDVTRLVVLDKEGIAIGMITEEDILTKIYKPKKKMTVGEVVGEKVPRMSQPVTSIMNSPLIYCDVEDTIPEVAKLMEKYDIRGVPAFKKGTLRGMVSRLDIMKYIKSLSKESTVEVIIQGEFEEELKELAERILTTEIQKIVKYANRVHWIKLVVKKEHDKGGTASYVVNAYVKTPKKLYASHGTLNTGTKLEYDGEDIKIISDKKRWDFMEVLKDALESIKKQIESDNDKYNPKHQKRKIKPAEVK